MKQSFRVQRKPALPRILLAFIIVVLCMCLFEAYRMIVPFQSENPLWHEVTIGEPVIDDWTYGGQDEEGYLRFVRGSTNMQVVIPPTEKMFDADGKFVVIEAATPSSLTYAEPYDAIPFSWILTGGLVIGSACSIGVFLFRRRQKQYRIRAFRRSKGMSVKLPRTKIPWMQGEGRWPTRSKKFRARKR